MLKIFEIKLDRYNRADGIRHQVCTLESGISKKSLICGRQCLAALNKFHKIQQNEIERIQGIVLKNIYTCDFDIDYSSEPSINKL